MNPGELRAYLTAATTDPNYEHMVFPGMVYISFPSEYGTLYTRRELEEIKGICESFSLPLMIDGARLGYGLTSPACELTLPDIARLCDVFYIGGTKVGCFCGEAVVFPRGNAPKHFYTITKQHGAMMAKGRLLGIQFECLLEDDTYLNISKHAVDLAQQIREAGLNKGWKLYSSSPTNQQFFVVPDAQLQILNQKYSYDIWEKLPDGHTAIRFCTSWATSQEQVRALVADIKAL
jgi:threonine aldolase